MNRWTWLLLVLAGLLGYAVERRTRYRSNPVELAELGSEGPSVEWSDADWDEAAAEAAAEGRSDVAYIRRLAQRMRR